MGACVLSEGLKRCQKLQHLSLEDCGIGPVGAAALASTCVPDADNNLAALQVRLHVLGHACVRFRTVFCMLSIELEDSSLPSSCSRR